MMKKVLVLFVFVFLLTPVFVAYGQNNCNPPGAPFTNPNLPPCSSLGWIDDPTSAGLNPEGGQPAQVSTITGVILQLVNWFSWFVGLVAVVMGLYSGFLFITARDNANQLTTARQTMMYAIIGIGVAIIAFSLVSLSRSLLNL